MVPKNGSLLPGSRVPLSSHAFAEAIGTVLHGALGDSRRAAKTLMAWTGVSDHTARSWLHGQSSPDGLHLVALVSHCRPIMAMVLYMAGHDALTLTYELEATEVALEAALVAVRELRKG